MGEGRKFTNGKYGFKGKNEGKGRFVEEVRFATRSS